MNSFGLSNEEHDFLKKELINILEPYDLSIFIFGSRTSGKARPFSDVDILIDDSSLTTEERAALKQSLGKIRETFIDSNFPYKLDLVLETEVADSYRSSIRASRVVIRSKKS